MSQRTIRWPDKLEAAIEAERRTTGHSFAGWVKWTVEKALGDRKVEDSKGLPAPPRPPRKTHASRTPPRPRPRVTKEEYDEVMAGPPLLNFEAEGLKNIVEEGVHEIEVPETPSGCADCGGDLVAHPEFGRFCTGCGARVR